MTRGIVQASIGGRNLQDEDTLGAELITTKD